MTAARLADEGTEMKKTYEKPTLTKRETLQAVSAGANCFVSPFFGDNCGEL